MPPFSALQAQNGVPNVVKTMPAVRSLPPPSPTLADQDFIIAGITRDSSGNVLGACMIYLFNILGGMPMITGCTTSDANGIYRFYVSPSYIYWVVTYKDGTPDVGGVSANNLVGV